MQPSERVALVAWVESHQELARHPKTRRLARHLDVSLPAVIGHLHLLWWWALDYADDGDLTRYEDGDIADAMLWKGDASTLVAELTSAGFLNADRTIHDWQDYAGRLVQRRRADADRLRNWRERNKDATQTGAMGNADETYTKRVTPHVTVPNRTGPNQTVPENEAAIAAMPPAAAAPERRTTAAVSDYRALSEDAKVVVDEWRRAHGKRSPPKLNPALTAKLETAVADLGVERLCEAARWSAEMQIPEFAKAIRAAYTKRQQDESADSDPLIARGQKHKHGARASPDDLEFTRGGRLITRQGWAENGGDDPAGIEEIFGHNRMSRLGWNGT